MQPMRLITRKLLCLFMLTMLCTTIALPAQAHEARVVGNGVYEIIFGWFTEPPVEDGPNKLFFAADVFDPPGQTETFAFLDRTEGDTVKVTAVPFRLDTDDVNSKNIAQVLAHIVEIFPPLTNFSQCDETSGCEGIGYVKRSHPRTPAPMGPSSSVSSRDTITTVSSFQRSSLLRRLSVDVALRIRAIRGSSALKSRRT